MPTWCFTQNYEMVLIKQNNIISKKLLVWMALLQSNYCMHWNINVTVIWWWMSGISSQWSKYWFWSYWKLSFWEYVRDREYEPVEVRSDDDSDGKIICSNLNPSKFQKVTKYALFYSFIIVLKISRVCFYFYFAIAAVWDLPLLDIYGSLKTRISSLVKHSCI